MKSGRESKYLALKQTLQEKIGSGELCPGDQLPTCRELAHEYNVSYLTATRAVSLLAAEGFIRSSQGRGSFVRPRTAAAGASGGEDRRVTLCAPPIEHPQVEVFLAEGRRLFAEHGWEVEVERPSRVREVLRLVKRPDYYTLLFGFNVSNYNDRYQIATHGRGRIVILGERFDFFGVTSVSCDNAYGIRLALDCLFKHGRTRVGLVCVNLAHIGELEALAALRCYYRKHGREAEVDGLVINIGMKQFEPIGEHAPACFRRCLDAGLWDRLDAVIAPEAETALLLGEFLAAHGYRVPEEIAMIAINDIADPLGVHRRLSCIDTDFPDQVRLGVEAMLKLAGGGGFDEVLYTCEPRLVLRDTTPQ